MRFLARRFAATGGPNFLEGSNRALSLLRIHADRSYCVVPKPSSVDGERPSLPDPLPDRSSAAESSALRPDLSLPPVTFGPKRWEYGHEECSDSDTLADDLRRDRDDEPVDSEAVAQGLAYVWKAFGIATVIVFGGASLIFGLVAAKLEIRSRDDIRLKGRELIRQKLDTVREQIVPLNKQAENLSQRWRGEEIAEQNQALGQKPS
ncbi:hypothetical protein MLD38_030505 [Melastoma candidum]|uniref:Uncharacterized protein n=1 Tax=Melastoma candidum TaxID=119954 RepID=A0ACB9MLD6_9MYRT|nr:hypothetical protein MLD38_030505 [Melastoma candidum]